MDTLTQAEQLSHALFDSEPDEDRRCIALARCLRVLAASIDHTDGYEPLTSCADQIEHQAQRNLAAIAEDIADREFFHFGRKYA